MAEPRIVLYDLETVPNMREAMKIWPRLSNYPGLTLRASVSTVICFGYQVLGEDKQQIINAWDFPGWQQNINDDKALVTAAYEILRDADCVVTHNGKRFDQKFLQTRLLINGLPALPKVHHADTKALASSNLYFLSNSLDNLAANLGLERKLDHEGWDLWVKVSERDPAACKLMSDYCKQDVKVLSQLFKKLKPFAKMPNYNLFTEVKGNVCPNCGSTLVKSDGWRHTQTRVLQKILLRQLRNSFQRRT